MSLLNILISALSCWQIVEIVHHGSIFAPLREWATRVELGTQAPHGREVFVLSFLARLIYCPFCLSFWAAVASIVLMLLGSPTSWIVAAFAVTRLAQLGNDLTYDWTRSPRYEEIIDESDGADEEGSH